jgi:hypothetical protein
MPCARHREPAWLPPPWLVWPLALALSACVGKISSVGSSTGGGGTAGPTGTAGSAPPGSTGGGGSVVTGAAGAAGTGSVKVDNGLPGRALIRRLSNAEYDATIKTLLGDATSYSSAFPADSVINGFTNNTDVQDVGPALAEQYTIAAEQISAKAAQNTDTLLGCKLANGETCISDFITRFGRRAWRRPLDSVEQADLLTVFRAGRDGFDATTGVQLLLQAFLVSPNFLYRPELGLPVAGMPYAALTSWEIASRLSYFLTGTMPDDALFAAAAADRLTTPDGIATEAKRLLATPAARAQVGGFFSGWLDLRAVDRLQRDTVQFPAWDGRLPALFSAETRAFATSVVFDGAGDLNTLLTATFTYGDPSLAAFYGGKAGTAQNGIARIDLPAGQRAGLLTQAGFLAAHSKEIETDPVSRGKFIRERMLCQGLQPPPPDLMITAPTITPGTTTRQRFAQHESEPVCAACHVMIDPIGLAFEHYDAIGQWRDQEQGLPIDASGNLTATDVAGPFNGVVEMAAKLAQSPMASACFVRQWFRFAFGRAESDSDDPRIATIAAGFGSAKGRVQDLMLALTQTPDFRYLARGM